MPPTNLAAWLPAKSVKPLVIGSAPYTSPAAGEIVVKNSAVALNPVDPYKQLAGDALLGYIKYPFILGGDVAGEVVDIGPGVQKFKIGDRVVAQAMGGSAASNNPAEGGFQHYTLIREYFAALIPGWVSYEQACVLPLALATAAYGLFHQDYLGLDPPLVPPPSSATKKAIIITGGASSVGSNAVQLAVSAGYEVYSTASPKNFAYVEKLGAARVFDYHSANLVDQIVDELQEKTLIGAYAIGNGSVESCIKVLRRCGGNGKKFIASVGPPVPQKPAKVFSSYHGMAPFILSTIWWILRTTVAAKFAGVKFKFIDCKELCQVDNIVSRLVIQDFLPRALAAKQFVPAPEPLVVGNGLEKIQEAMEVVLEGVSAQKVVVKL